MLLLYRIPQNLDLITCNPPWLPLSFLNGSNLSTILDPDNAIYDPEERFLISMFNFAKQNLALPSPATPTTPELLLIYSDFAQKLGVQPAGRVRELGREFGFGSVEMVDRVRMPASKRNRH